MYIGGDHGYRHPLLSGPFAMRATGPDRPLTVIATGAAVARSFRPARDLCSEKLCHVSYAAFSILTIA